MNDNSLQSTQTNNADGFVDFYQLIDQEDDVPTIQLRTRINEIYAEAQATRDHRNAERRRQSALLLQWIPQARIVLLHEGKRAKYDVYAAQARIGKAPMNFRAYLDEIVGESDLDLGEGQSILGMREDEKEAPAAVARLSPRLDAARAAASEAAVRASETAANVGQAAAEIPTKPAPVQFPPVDVDAPNKKPSTPTNARSKPTTSLNPALQQERASLLSSAIGVATLLVVLVVAKIALPTMGFAIPSAIALVAGFVMWRFMHARLLSNIDSKR